MDEQLTRRPAGLGRALGRGLRDAYDNLGYVVAVTFASFLITSAVLWSALLTAKAAGAGPCLAWRMALLPTAFTGWLCAVGAFYYVGKVVCCEHPTAGDVWQGIRTLFVPAVGLFVVDCLFVAVLVVDVEFFLAVSRAKAGIPLMMLGILSGYLALVWVMMSLYHLPVLVAQTRMESGPRTRIILRKAFLLTFDNPVFTVGLFLVIITFTVLCALPRFIGMAILYLGVTAFLLTHALRELFIKYGIVEEEPEVVEDKPWRLPDSWLKRQGPGVNDSDETGGITDG